MTARSVRFRFAGLICLAVPLSAWGQGLEPRVAAGKSLSAAGSLLQRVSPTKSWQTVGKDQSVFSRDVLLALPGIQAEVEPRPESVRLTLWGNLLDLASFPGMEAAAVLHDSRALDLDFTLVRGRVVVTNNKAKGPAKVWVRLPSDGWLLTLAHPGDAVALEMVGRWPGGVPFTRTPGPGDRPTTLLTLLVLKGQLELRAGDDLHVMAAAPGPAELRWDSLAGRESSPRRRDKPPAWLDPGEGAKQLDAIAADFRDRLEEKGPEAALLDLVGEASRAENKARAALLRRFALLGLGAIDDVAKVAEALADASHPELRETAVISLRHWIGDSGNDLSLFRVLVERLRYPPAQAETILQLLHSPFAADAPESYETLIAYLGHGKLAVRELARWHLYRLVPAGRTLGYDAAAPEAEREKALSAWKKLIPSGKLPPKEKKTD